MKKSWSYLARTRFFVPIAALIFIFATFPGKGGLEGDQRDIPLLTNRTDNWGFIVPFGVGNWPDYLGHWRFTLVLFQLIIFWVGIWLLLRNAWTIDVKLRPLISLLVLVSSVFVSQLWRDASLLALATFALGILSKALERNNKLKLVLVSLSVLILHMAAMFKVLYGIILGLFFLWMVFDGFRTKTLARIASIFVIFSLTFIPFIADKQLSRMVGLQKVYPEQQPIIFDLASNYCWGQSEQLVRDAAEGLKIVLKPNIPLPAVCAALRPNSWDNLHSNPVQWEFNSPIKRIVGDNEKQLAELRSSWFFMVSHNPVDWVQTRFMYLGWTLTLSNSFVLQNSDNSLTGFFGFLNSNLWNAFFKFASLIDKARFTSILFAFFVVLLLLVRAAIASNGSRVIFLSQSSYLFSSLIILIATTIVTLVGFVASNGRYVLPYVILTYLLLFRSLAINRQVCIHH